MEPLQNEFQLVREVSLEIYLQCSMKLGLKNLL
jgi:hypothetical protein